MRNPLDEHWKVVKRVFRYLSGTLQYCLKFTKSSDFRLIAFCDADWDSDMDDRKSTGGYCVYFRSNLISWSSTNAEYRSMAVVITEITWLQSLLSELHVPYTILLKYTVIVPVLYYLLTFPYSTGPSTLSWIYFLFGIRCFKSKFMYHIFLPLSKSLMSSPKPFLHLSFKNLKPSSWLLISSHP